MLPRAWSQSETARIIGSDGRDTAAWGSGQRNARNTGKAAQGPAGSGLPSGLLSFPCSAAPPRLVGGDVGHQREVLDEAARLSLGGVRGAEHAPLAGLERTGAGHLRTGDTIEAREATEAR